MADLKRFASRRNRGFIPGLLLMLFTSSIFAQTVHNVGTGQTFTTIAAAIGSPSVLAGDIINVVDPIHTEWGILVNKDLTIQGLGGNTTIVQANAVRHTAPDRVFDIPPGQTVIIQDMFIQYGNKLLANGGGINNLGDLTLINVNLYDCYSDYHGGGIYNGNLLTIYNSCIWGNATSANQSQPYK